MQETIFVQPL